MLFPQSLLIVEVVLAGREKVGVSVETVDQKLPSPSHPVTPSAHQTSDLHCHAVESIMNVQESRAERKERKGVSPGSTWKAWMDGVLSSERKNEGKVRGKIERRNNRASTTQPVQPRLDWTLYSAVLCSVKCSVQWRPPWM